MLDINDNNPNIVKDYFKYLISIKNMSLFSVRHYICCLSIFIKFFSRQKENTFVELKSFNKTNIRNLPDNYFYDVDLNSVLSFFSYLTNVRKISSKTRNVYLSVLNNFFNYLLKRNLIATNPFIGSFQHYASEFVPRFFTLDESKKILQTALVFKKDNKNPQNIRDYAMINLFLNSGIRLSELININIKDIKLDESKIFIKGKGNKERIIYLNDSCIEALKKYIDIRLNLKPKEIYSIDALFLSNRLKRISRKQVYNLVKSILNKANFDTTIYSVHNLRHTAATLMFQYGKVDIRILQEVLGHENLSTTEIYVHVSNRQIKDALDNASVNNIIEKGGFFDE